MDKDTITLRTKTWIVDENKDTLFGAGQLKILETIERTGSISAAAKEMKMGYRSMWGRIRKVEQRTGKSLLIRHKGGSDGGRSELTEDAKLMVSRFKALQQRIDDAAQDIFHAIYFPE
ncbi:MAG: LysR family transcriptional regulator [Desulfobacteraceae bacterium]|nr:MAG: LysR family transcriptional regulator [Desulfobacteraceae bacterium]